MDTTSPRIVHGVPGPAGQPGILLLVPPSEALDWDLRDEVASTSRHWMADRQAWWVAQPYASTAVAIASRFNGGRPPVEEQPTPPAAPSLPVESRFRRAVRRMVGLVRRWLFHR